MSSSLDNTAAAATVPSSSSSSSSSAAAATASTSLPIPSAPPAPPNDSTVGTDFDGTNNPNDAFTDPHDTTSSNIGTSTMNPTKGSYSAANDMMKSMQTDNDTAKQNAETSSNSGGGSKKDDSLFECNICLDTAKEAVVSLCGHLFCWPCLHQWLETRPTRQLCPVCKAAISKEKVVPLYGRSSQQEDPRSKVPPRPAGQRTEPEPNATFQGFGFGDGGFQMSLGIGAFPFGIFTSTFSTFNFGTNLRSQSMYPSTTVQFEEDHFLSKAFIWVALLFLAWLVLA